RRSALAAPRTARNDVFVERSDLPPARAIASSRGSAGNADGPFHRRRLRRYGGVMTQSTPALFCECAFVSAKRPRWRAGFSERVTGTTVAPDSNGFHLFLVGGIACIIEPGLVVTCVRPRGRPRRWHRKQRSRTGCSSYAG